MFVLYTMTVPPDKARELGEAFVKASRETPYPPFVKLTLYACSDESGIKTYAIYEVKDEKAAEGLRVIENRYIQYQGIVGLRYKAETIRAGKEALAMIGIKMP